MKSPFNLSRASIHLSRKICPAFFVLIAALSSASGFADVAYKGINLSGGEYGGCGTADAKYGFKYIYPGNNFIDSFGGSGMNIFRLPFCWERIQPTAKAALNSEELDRIDKLVKYATANGKYIILDVHNYAGYWRTPITLANAGDLADLWKKLAAVYKNNDKVIFGLMNEPIKISGEDWVTIVNTTIREIRASGAKNLILVPGVAWTGAHSWAANSYGTPNAVTSLNVVDSGNRYAYEVHQYLDKDSSGTSADCVNETIGVTRIAAFESWLRANNKKAFLGEFAGGRNATCFKAMSNLLDELRKNGDIWLGWTYWNTGLWTSNYMFNIPVTAADQPSTQMDVLKNFLTSSAGCNPALESCLPAAPTLKGVQSKAK